jgi:hypothetical protein
MTTPVFSAEYVAEEIDRIITASALNQHPDIRQTLQSITARDENFAQSGGAFFHLADNAFTSAENFTHIHIDRYRQTARPSLPALAVYHALRLELDSHSPEYKALLLVAVRAEIAETVEPDYHNRNHYLDVAALTANLLAKNNHMAQTGDAAALTKAEQALTLLAAVGHDLGHAGKSNPPDQPLFNEENSFQLMEPLLLEAGLHDAQIVQVRTILRTTSPNGAHAVLKEAAKRQRDGAEQKRDGTIAAPPTNPLFAELQTTLANNPKLTQMAAMVSDADLYGSAGAGLQANRMMSGWLTAEGRKYNNSSLDFTTDAARLFFFDSIVGKDGFASTAGRTAGNAQFQAMRAETAARPAMRKSNPPPSL